MTNPFKAVLDIRRHELPLALLMFSYFFLVITSFWILKPIKKALFIQYYDTTGFTLLNWHMTASQAELIAKVLNMLVAIIAVIVFTWLSRHFRRQQLTYCFSAFFLAGYVLYSPLIVNPTDLTVWTFYLFGDLFSTLMVATFFVFLNDSVTPAEAKRLYGLIGLGGVVGGVFGTSAVRLWIDDLDRTDWLWVCFAIAIIIIAIAMSAGRFIKRRDETDVSLKDDGKQSHDNPAFEGALLVFKSRYMLAIACVVGLYEIVSTLLDFQFTATVSHYLDGDAIGRQFSMVFAITNWVSMFVQLFLTSLVMTRFGLTVALMVLPVAILAGSAGFFSSSLFSGLAVR
ncbi:MAG: MFS transporter [bacterium]|nr:MFS transporter [bacterium]